MCCNIHQFEYTTHHDRIADPQSHVADQLCGQSRVHCDKMLKKVGSKEESAWEGGQVVTKDQHTKPMNGNRLQCVEGDTVLHHQTSGG